MLASFLSTAILSLYLKHLFVIDGMEQGDAEDLATALYHAFIFLSYFTSLFGAYLADSFLGKKILLCCLLAITYL